MALIPTQNTLTVGGRVFTDLDNLIILYSYGNGSNCTFRKGNGTSGYIVPGGKTFKVLALIAEARSGGGVDFYYTDNDMGVSSVTAPVNPVYLGGAAGLISEVVQAVTGVKVEKPVQFNVPTGKYIGMTPSGLTTLVIFGYEV